MRRVLIVCALVGVCGTISAHNEECNYSTDYNVNIESDSVIFSKTGGEKFEFRGDQLIVNNKKVVLDEDQLEAAQNLQRDTRKMVPKIALIAVDGAELGIKATTIVMTSLFGDDQQVHQDLIAPIEALSDRIKQNISSKTFNVEALEKSIDESFDEELEQLLSTAISKYSGKIVSSVLASVFSGDTEEIEDLEFRMENMEREIETYVEENAGDLEQRANALCADIAIIDQFDNALASVEGYPTDGLIYKDSEKGIKFSGMSIDLD